MQTLAQKLTSDLKASTAAPEVASYAYNPFGEMLGDAVSGYGYNGEYFDASVGMLNLRARMYEPLTIRFSQRDLVPGDIGETITLNRYLYCQNNPLSFCDPLGTSVFKKLVSAAKSAAKGAKSAAKAVAAKAVSTAAIDTVAVVLDYAVIYCGAKYGAAFGAAITVETGPGAVAGAVVGGIVGAAVGIAFSSFVIDRTAEYVKDNFLKTDDDKNY